MNFTELSLFPKKLLKKMIQTSLDKFNFVTREEFEVQKKVLLRTRKKLEQMEATLDTYRSINSQ